MSMYVHNMRVNGRERGARASTRNDAAVRGRTNKRNWPGVEVDREGGLHSFLAMPLALLCAVANTIMSATCTCSGRVSAYITLSAQSAPVRGVMPGRGAMARR